MGGKYLLLLCYAMIMVQHVSSANMQGQTWYIDVVGTEDLANISETLYSMVVKKYWTSQRNNTLKIRYHAHPCIDDQELGNEQLEVRLAKVNITECVAIVDTYDRCDPASRTLGTWAESRLIPWIVTGSKSADYISTAIDEFEKKSTWVTGLRLCPSRIAELRFFALVVGTQRWPTVDFITTPLTIGRIHGTYFRELSRLVNVGMSIHYVTEENTDDLIKLLLRGTPDTTIVSSPSAHVLDLDDCGPFLQKVYDFDMASSPRYPHTWLIRGRCLSQLVNEYPHLVPHFEDSPVIYPNSLASEASEGFYKEWISHPFVIENNLTNLTNLLAHYWHTGYIYDAFKGVALSLLDAEEPGYGDIFLDIQFPFGLDPLVYRIEFGKMLSKMSFQGVSGWINLTVTPGTGEELGNAGVVFSLYRYHEQWHLLADTFNMSTLQPGQLISVDMLPTLNASASASLQTAHTTWAVPRVFVVVVVPTFDVSHDGEEFPIKRKAIVEEVMAAAGLAMEHSAEEEENPWNGTIVANEWYRPFRMRYINPEGLVQIVQVVFLTSGCTTIGKTYLLENLFKFIRQGAVAGIVGPHCEAFERVIGSLAEGWDVNVISSTTALMRPYPLNFNIAPNRTRATNVVTELVNHLAWRSVARFADVRHRYDETTYWNFWESVDDGYNLFVTVWYIDLEAPPTHSSSILATLQAAQIIEYDVVILDFDTSSACNSILERARDLNMLSRKSSIAWILTHECARGSRNLLEYALFFDLPADSTTEAGITEAVFGEEIVEMAYRVGLTLSNEGKATREARLMYDSLFFFLRAIKGITVDYENKRRTYKNLQEELLKTTFNGISSGTVSFVRDADRIVRSDYAMSLFARSRLLPDTPNENDVEFINTAIYKMVLNYKQLATGVFNGLDIEATGPAGSIPEALRAERYYLPVVGPFYHVNWNDQAELVLLAVTTGINLARADWGPMQWGMNIKPIHIASDCSLVSGKSFERATKIPEVIAIVGDMCDASTKILAQMAGDSRTYTVSYGAQSPELADRLNFPSFARTCPDRRDDMKSLASLISNFGWREVAAIHFIELQLVQASGALSEELRTIGITLRIENVPTKVDNSLQDMEIRKALTAIRDTTTSKVIVLFGWLNCIEILRQAEILEMIDTYIWIPDKYCVSDKTLPYLKGTFFVAEYWTTAPMHRIFNSRYTSSPEMMDTKDPFELESDTPRIIPPSEITHAAWGYDAYTLIMAAVSEVLRGAEDGLKKNGKDVNNEAIQSLFRTKGELRDQITNVLQTQELEFTGATGTQTFKDGYRDRMGWAVFNIPGNTTNDEYIDLIQYKILGSYETRDVRLEIAPEDVYWRQGLGKPLLYDLTVSLFSTSGETVINRNTGQICNGTLCAWQFPVTAHVELQIMGVAGRNLANMDDIKAICSMKFVMRNFTPPQHYCEFIITGNMSVNLYFATVGNFIFQGAIICISVMLLFGITGDVIRHFFKKFALRSLQEKGIIKPHGVEMKLSVAEIYGEIEAEGRPKPNDIKHPGKEVFCWSCGYYRVPSLPSKTQLKSWRSQKIKKYVWCPCCGIPLTGQTWSVQTLDTLRRYDKCDVRSIPFYMNSMVNVTHFVPYSAYFMWTAGVASALLNIFNIVYGITGLPERDFQQVQIVATWFLAMAEASIIVITFLHIAWRIHRTLRLTPLLHRFEIYFIFFMCEFPELKYANALNTMRHWDLPRLLGDERKGVFRDSLTASPRDQIILWIIYIISRLPKYIFLLFVPAVALFYKIVSLTAKGTNVLEFGFAEWLSWLAFFNNLRNIVSRESVYAEIMGHMVGQRLTRLTALAMDAGGSFAKSFGLAILVCVSKDFSRVYHTFIVNAPFEIDVAASRHHNHRHGQGPKRLGRLTTRSFLGTFSKPKLTSDKAPENNSSKKKKGKEGDKEGNLKEEKSSNGKDIQEGVKENGTGRGTEEVVKGRQADDVSIEFVGLDSLEPPALPAKDESRDLCVGVPMPVMSQNGGYNGSPPYEDHHDHKKMANPLGSSSASLRSSNIGSVSGNNPNQVAAQLQSMVTQLGSCTEDELRVLRSALVGSWTSLGMNNSVQQIGSLKDPRPALQNMLTTCSLSQLPGHKKAVLAAVRGVKQHRAKGSGSGVPKIQLPMPIGSQALRAKSPVSKRSPIGSVQTSLSGNSNIEMMPLAPSLGSTATPSDQTSSPPTPPDSDDDDFNSTAQILSKKSPSKEHKRSGKAKGGSAPLSSDGAHKAVTEGAALGAIGVLGLGALVLE